MANISTLGTLLDTLSAKTGGMIPANLSLFMTEFGFETNPPDPFNGVSLRQPGAVQPDRRVPGVVEPADRVAGAVPPARRRTGSQPSEDLEGVLVHVPVRPLRSHRPAQAGGPGLRHAVPGVQHEHARPGDRHAGLQPLGAAAVRDQRRTRPTRRSSGAQRMARRRGSRSAIPCRSTRWATSRPRAARPLPVPGEWRSAVINPADGTPLAGTTSLRLELNRAHAWRVDPGIRGRRASGAPGPRLTRG